jgi:hypothetical protein
MSVVMAIPIAVLVGGCGAAPPIATQGWPACAAVPSAVAVPDGFDRTIPLPAGLRVSRVSHEANGGVELTGLVPSSLPDVAAFFSANLPAAGFTVSEGESGAGEAEATFAGPTSTGRLAAHPMSDCQGVVQLSISATSE